MNFENPDNITLETIGGGAAVEKFNIEMGDVIKNILDVNYPAIDKRTITLKVHLKASVDRNYCSVTIECSSALAKRNSFTAGMYVGLDKEGNPIASENLPKQTTFADLRNDSNITDIREAK